MPLNNNGWNALLTGGLTNVVVAVGLHTGDPSTTGTNEMGTGGSPVYIRKAVTFNAPSGGTATSNVTLTFDVPASTVYHVGLWSTTTVGSGTFYGYFPVGGFAAKAATVAQSTGTFTSYAHGYANGQQVLVYGIQTGADPEALTQGTVYFVVGAATDTFQLALTSGGAAITGGANGQCAVQRVLPEVFAAQGQYQIASGSLILDARFVG